MSTGELSKAFIRRNKTSKKAVLVPKRKNQKKEKSAPTAVAPKQSSKLINKSKKSPLPVFKKPTNSIKKGQTEGPSTKGLAIPASLALVVLSPLRFPLDVDKIAVQTARIAGALFVVIGAILTMAHATFVFSAVPPISFLAQIWASNQSAPTVVLPENPKEDSQPSLIYVDTQVAFGFAPSDPITGSAVQVKVELPSETSEVYLYARDTNTGATVSFGAFTSFDGRFAETYIDVTKISDGLYRFYAIATYVGDSGKYTITIKDTKRQEIYAVQDEVIEVQAEPEAEQVPQKDEVPQEEKRDREVAQYQQDDGEPEPEPEQDEVVDPDEDLEIDEPIDEAVEDDQPNPVDPTIEITMAAPRITGTTDMQVKVTEATYLEVYALQENTGTERYIGLPKYFSGNIWRLNFDTRNLPNGLYSFVVKVRTKYGFFTKKSDITSVYNETTTITNDAVRLYEVKAEQIIEETRVNKLPDTITDATITETLSSAEREHQFDFEKLLEKHRNDIEGALEVLVVAYRSGDTDQIDVAVERINNLIDSFGIDSPEFFAFTKKEIEKLTLRITTDVETTNKIISERTGVKAETDTDRDGITDFDEIVIYKTDPYAADSDADGFTDGAEVLSGYNPADSTPEALIAYESPTTGGIVREDLLSIETIATEAVEESDTAVALLTGKGLPNSFVTLYIFSTPIVVTVRTDSQGSWIYRFDKELEDGEHQVYAGITDNDGKIVAKSNPLSFVKTAQAYSPIDAPAPGTQGQTLPEEETDSMMYLILVTASISIVAIGLVLILLGMHLDNRSRRLELKANESS